MRQHKLWYQSSYDRGLEHLLFIWGDIKKQFPDATLDITYGWNLFDIVFTDNAERQEWKKSMVMLMDQPGIKEHGRLGKKELHELRKQCGIWAYPSHFTEINCIGALETQADGLVPVTMALAALKETVFSGVLVTGDINDIETRDKYLKELLSMMGDETRWKAESKKAIRGAKDYSWDKISDKWLREFDKKDESIKLTVYTPTVRKGFWNLMAHNLSKQTYKNFEWLIIDDIGYDRSKIASEYAKKYGLDIKYVKGKERSKKRNYALVNANNTALEKASGNLIVFLQDFILLPLDGLEQLAILHKKNPEALLAPVDMYFTPKIKPNVESEDWFNGEVEIIGDFIRQNVRIQNKGLRKSENPYDFEQNYGAIPVKVAKELGGWYEVYDFGLGYDNTDMSYRAMLKGYEVLVDETNCAICIDHWEALKENGEKNLGRARRLNDPIFLFMKEMIKLGKVPLVRDEEIDNKLDLQYEIPEDIDDNHVVEWINKNGPLLVSKWLEETKL